MRTARPLFSPLFFVGSKLVGLVKLSFLLGSSALFFSGANCVTPLVGSFCGLGGSTLFFWLAVVVRMAFYGGLVPLSYFVHYVPGLFAGYYWASRSVLRVVVPASCMLLFMIHPVGGVVWFYALYWLIPIGLYLLKRDHLLLTALGSTFTAHAVGSVIWLYTVPTDPALWIGLMPIVPLERFMFAGGMVLMHTLISWLFDTGYRLSQRMAVRAA